MNKVVVVVVAWLLHKGRKFFIPLLVQDYLRGICISVVFRFLEELSDKCTRGESRSDDKVSSKDVNKDRENLDTLL